MNVLPTPEGSPAVTPNDSSQIGRKRQRSQSMESDASSSSLKRAPANPGSQDSTRADQMSTLSLTDANLDIDAYMAEQGEEDLEKTTILERPQRHDVKNLPPDEKWALVEGEVKRPMRVGETWYLVERGWWKRWKKACTGKIDKDEPVSEQDLGPVDNSQLLDSHGNLKSPLSEGVDLEYVPEETFQHFVDWYGEPIHPLPRRIVERGATKKTDIELRPPTLNVLRLSSAKSNTRAKRITISAGETVKTLNAKLAAAASPPGDQTQSYRVWKINPPEDDVTSIEFSSSELSAADGKLSGDSEKTLEEEGVQSEDWFVVEYQHDGAWTAEETAGVAAPPATNFGKPPAPLFSFNSEDSFFNKFAKSNKDKDKVTKKNHFTVKEKSIEPGTLGLGNMGNTCFMNSAIQCLAHNKELSDYFFTGLFKEELNPGNPLGMGGAIAESFGALLHRIWAKTGPSYYSPRDFKLQLQRFAPQFSGYQQHDSQELVAFLLDGLHEDLNRVLKKPYVEKPDWEGGDDVDLVKLAKKSWEGYMLRNDSVIVDLFQGQYQSTLVCPECNKVSITFDPFMYLTLPLPIQKKWKHTIYYVPWDLSKTHVQVPIEINGNSSFKDLRNLLGRWMDAPSENLLTLEIFSHKFYKNLDDTVMVGDMAHNDLIVCFELPCHAQQSRNYKRQPGDPIIVPVSLIDATAPSSSARYQSHLPKSGFGYPFVVPVYEEDAKSKEALYDLLLIQLQRWTMNARDLFTWEEGRITELSELTVNGFPPAKDALTEIKENGEVVTVQAAEPPEEEGDIVDEKAMMLDDADPALSAEVLQPRRVGPKKDLFNIRLQTGQKEYGTQQYSRFDSKSYESWADRLKEVGPDAPIVKEGDAFQLEFDESLKAYYFGDEQSKWEHALWETWETFEHSEYLAGKKVASDKANKDLTLQDCLDEFTKQEQLGEDDLWYCPQCKKHQPATKKFQLWTTPDILVVHLKRFSNNRLLRDKIDAFIDFPIEGLDLSDAVGERAIATKLVEQGISLEELELNSHEEPLIYDLFAVDEHIGGLGGGHYRAYALNHANGKWYHFDDSHVSPAKPDEAVNPNAYLLFYRRRTSEPLGGKSHQRIEEARAKAEAEAEAASVADAETTQEDDSREMKVDLHLPTPPNEEANGPLKDDVWAMLKNNDSSKSYLSSSGMNPALDYSPFGDRSFADNFNNAVDEEDHSMKGPGDYSLIAPAYRMPDFPHLTPWRNDFSDAERQKDHIKRYLRDDVDNEDERGSTQASEYPDPSVNVSPSSSNAAEIDSDDLEDLEDPDWAANSTDMPDDQVFPKPLTSQSKLATMKEEAEAEAKSADVAKEVIPTDVSEKDSTL